ncbi:hypothetical protein PR003_g13963 [Phytophthora rubi]|uniref:Uncharacterized protein n=1 Tax=Phytophthora rubi TaxID=129364 RepID=A0A6A3LPK3_9STRA|nr:hypothetical protein PR002_g13498 [Phytophthora rubi]KAE9021501.1 hypothetical protein PR001_g13358 [Phytophthora rubi]KAE9333566.1 hypothetical protein PR003_g13963 [Phytophthora rubi]
MLAQQAAEVAAKFATCPRECKFFREDTTNEIGFNEVVVVLAEDAWLNDAVISHALAVMCEGKEGVHTLSSLVVNSKKFPTPPRLRLFSMEFIVLPVNHGSNRWTLIVVEV